MKFTYSGKDIVSESLQERAEKKLGKFDRYFKEEPETLLRFRMQKGGQNKVELTMSCGGTILRAEEVGADMYTCVDRAADKLEGQIKRYRTKLEKRFREGAAAIIEADAADIEVPEPSFDVARIKKFIVKPMSVEDAIVQMEMLGHDFYLFGKEDGSGINLLYRRDDGSYGVLQPEL